MFWITRSQVGERGRVYYSPIGRAEAVQGFIEVTSDDDGLQRIIGYAGQLFAISKTRVFQIFGTNPYAYREIPGVPGTTSPHSVTITPFGPAWKASDGVRIFTGGAQSKLLAYDAVKPIFRGEAVEALSAWTGYTVATFARGEYIISEGLKALAINLETLKWRDIGIGFDAIFYSQSEDIVAANFNSENYVIDLEDTAETDDNGELIRFDIMPGHINFVPPAVIETIRVDADANTEVLSCYSHLDGSSLHQGNLTLTAGRRFTEFDVGARLVNRLGVQIIGDVNSIVEVHSIEIEYWPMVLALIIDGKVTEIPGRLSGDSQTLTFEVFREMRESLNLIHFFDTLLYDLDDAGETITATLNGADGISISLGTINTTNRQIDDRAIGRIAHFESLVISGDFTAAVQLRKLELIAQTVYLELNIDGNVRKIPGKIVDNLGTLVFELIAYNQDSMQNVYLFDRLFYDIDTNSEDLTVNLTLIDESGISLGTINNSTRTIDEINIGKKGRFLKLSLAGDFTAAIQIRRLELTASIARR